MQGGEHLPAPTREEMMQGEADESMPDGLQELGESVMVLVEMENHKCTHISRPALQPTRCGHGRRQPRSSCWKHVNRV